MTGTAGALAPVPVTEKDVGFDQFPCTNCPSTACTRQKYVPLLSPLTASCVAPLVEFWATIVPKLDDVLTCQLYATMPLESVTEDQEIVKGTCTLAPLDGAKFDG